MTALDLKQVTETMGIHSHREERDLFPPNYLQVWCNMVSSSSAAEQKIHSLRVGGGFERGKAEKEHGRWNLNGT